MKKNPSYSFFCSHGYDLHENSFNRIFPKHFIFEKKISIFKKFIEKYKISKEKDTSTIKKKIKKNLSKNVKKIVDKQLYIIDEPCMCLEDLYKISINEKYNNNKRYNLNINILRRLTTEIKICMELIGLKSIKKHIFNIIIYYLQDLNDCDNMLHTVIIGKSGMGKTLVANLLAKIYSKIGILSSNETKITNLKRNDLIGKFMGQTSIKTIETLNKCIGGIIIIDEAYSLGDKTQKDSYSKECIDSLTAFLSEHKNEIICIIAGYENELNSCFFNTNSGLERRFPYKLTIEEYSNEELLNIFKSKINEPWKIEKNALTIKMIEDNKHMCKHGGDIENLIHNCKIEHSINLLNQINNTKFLITKIDIENILIKNMKNKIQQYQQFYL